MADLSIVIPHYGPSGQTERLIAQLLPQLGEVDGELIVADDASPVRFPDLNGVLTVRRDRNGGFGSNVNSGAARASGRLLLILNSDTEVQPGWLRELVQAAAPHLPGIVSPLVVHPDGSSAGIGRLWPTPGRLALTHVSSVARLVRFRPFRTLSGVVADPAPGASARPDWLAGVALLMPTALFRELGGFDERFFMYCEEIDLQRRAAGLGHPRTLVACTPLVHAAGGSTDAGKWREWQAVSYRRYFDKWRVGLRYQAMVTAVELGLLAVNSVKRVAGRPARPFTSFRLEMVRIWGPLP